MLERARGQLSRAEYANEGGRFRSEALGVRGKILSMGEAWSDEKYLSPSLDGEWLEDSDTGGGNSVENSCTGPGER